MTCVERKQEALRTLMNLQAAKTLHAAASTFKVEDPKSEWRIEQWYARYIKAASAYAFFCEQSPAENRKVAQTIHEKEGLEAKKAALRGLEDATFKKKEKDNDTHEKKQKKLIKLMADKARLERLRSYPQSTIDLIGFVANANTGKPLVGVDVKSHCPFDLFRAKSQAPTEHGHGLHDRAQYKIANGIKGPEGYRCALKFDKAGFIPLSFHVIIPGRHQNHEHARGIFRHAVMLPKMETPPPFRVVMQYGSYPVHLDGHLQMYAQGAKDYYDVSGHAGAVSNTESGNFVYTKTGHRKEMPFVTMDVNHNEGFGPQTHTIHELKPGVYGYYVKNFDHHFATNLAFHKSQAKVFLYKGNKLEYTFHLDNAVGNVGPFWQVFSMNCVGTGANDCQIQPLGEFLKVMPTYETMANTQAVN